MKRNLGLGLLAVITTLPVLLRGGWPHNHEALAFLERTEAFRRAFQVGDFFPVWTPHSQLGYGAPYPLFYHRLYYTLSGFMALGLGSSHLAVKLLTPLLLWLGAIGMQRLLLTLAVAPRFATCGAALFVIAPYTLTDWLVRGAMAEFLAAMLIPWLLTEMVEVQRGRPRWLRLAILSVALYYAHVMICYFFVIFLVICVVDALVTRRLTVGAIGQHWRWIAGALALFLAATLPHVLAVRAVAPFFGTEGLQAAPWRPEDNFVPLQHYLMDLRYHWGRHWRGFSVEMNRYVLFAVIVLAVIAGKRKVRVLESGLLFLLTVFCICVFLQLPQSKVIYNALPMARYLQFPWRLLVFLSPLLIVFLACLADRLAGSIGRRGTSLLVFGVVGLSLSFPVLALRTQYEWFSPSSLEEVQENPGTGWWSEYLPRGVRREDLREDVPLVTVGGGQGRDQLPDAFVSRELAFTITSAEACTVSVRQFHTPVLAITVACGHVVSKAPASTILVVTDPGTTRIVVRPRSLFSLAAAGLGL